MKKRDRKQPKGTRIGFCIFVLAFIVALLCQIAGILIGKQLPDLSKSPAGILYPLSVLIAAMIPIANILLKKRKVKQLDALNLQQRHDYFLSHRDQAAETAAEKLRLLGKLRRRSTAAAVLVSLLGMFIAFVPPLFFEGTHTSSTLFACLVLAAGLERIRIILPEKQTEWENFMGKSEFPMICSLAESAAKELHCTDQICLCLTSDASVSIVTMGKRQVLLLGVYALDVLSQEELYAVFLHEFSHIMTRSKADLKEAKYASWLEETGFPFPFKSILMQYFSYLDALYVLEFSLYQFANSLQCESAADQAMADHSEAAASSLRKLNYWELHQWEINDDRENLFVTEEMPKNPMKPMLDRFREAIVARSDAWDAILKSEIPARTASHPTTAMRIARLGFAEFPPLFPFPDGAYRRECDLAVELNDFLVYHKNEGDYHARRKVQYLEPLERLNAWEAAGKPLVAEEYGDILNDMDMLCRTADKEALCARAIRELSPVAAAQAHFVLGCILLHRWDPAGLTELYAAISQSNNLAERCLDEIGAFCCATGRQAELEEYRKKVVELGQRQMDTYDHIGSLRKKDKLSAEQLPEGMLEDILAHITAEPDNGIRRIFLIRKTVTADFFTSAFILEFEKGTDPEVMERVEHRAFRYLDTCSDWQFSLFRYSDVPRGLPEKIPGSCVYESKKE